MNFIYKIAPHFLQNMLISLFNIKSYWVRHGSYYKKYRLIFKNNDSMTLVELKKNQNERYREFMLYVQANSKFYSDKLKFVSDFNVEALPTILPVVSKEEIRKSLDDVFTIPKSEGQVSKTGGTSGKSLEIIFTNENLQERFAMLDNFRAKFGYRLRSKTAWLSGKGLLNNSDISKKRFWKTDYIHNVRYYSTFHIKEDYLKYYVEDLIKFKPEFIVGFPTSVFEVAQHGIANGYEFPSNVIKAIFTTSETMTDQMRIVSETFFKSKIYNQYASSEGAPFIFECIKGNLHLELQSGVYEVLDDNNQPTNSGRLVVTPFATKGTPLVRYDIGDTITLEPETKDCGCGNHNPLVKELSGRIDDFIYSPQNGKINLVNIANSLKDTHGIIKFQIIQDELEKLHIKIIIDKEIYTNEIENKFIKNLRERVGPLMEITLLPVDDIPNEVSGKYRVVKNNIKHLL